MNILRGEWLHIHLFSGNKSELPGVDTHESTTPKDFSEMEKQIVNVTAKYITMAKWQSGDFRVISHLLMHL